MNSQARIRLSDYLQHAHDDLHLFWAEHVWQAISAARPDANALELEGHLARLADAVIIIVESAGTLAELGAFANSPSLRAKILPILDVQYRNEESFVNTGPVRWVSEDSSFAPPIWVSLEQILAAALEVDERLSRIPSAAKRAPASLADSDKHLLFFVCDLVAVFGPCRSVEITRLLEELVPGADAEAELLLALGVAMKVLNRTSHEGEHHYLRPLESGRLSAFHRTRRFMDIPTLRAKVLSARLSFSEGRASLQAAAAT